MLAATYTRTGPAAEVLFVGEGLFQFLIARDQPNGLAVIGDGNHRPRGAQLIESLVQVGQFVVGEISARHQAGDGDHGVYLAGRSLSFHWMKYGPDWGANAAAKR